MKTIDIRTKKGQKELLNGMIELVNFGYDEDEHDLEQYQKGYIQALKDILGIEPLTFSMNRKIYTNDERRLSNEGKID